MIIISKNLYEERAKSHRAIWRWIAETEKSKGYWPGWYGNVDDIPDTYPEDVPSHMHGGIVSCCFACAVCANFRCKNGCPIISFRIKDNKSCAQVGGLYDLYQETQSYVKRKKYAKIMAELPWFTYEIYIKYLGVELYSFDLPEIEKAYGPLEFKY